MDPCSALLGAALAVLPFLHDTRDPNVTTLQALPPIADQLRQQADDLDRKDKAVEHLRNAVKACQDYQASD